MSVTIIVIVALIVLGYVVYEFASVNSSIQRAAQSTARADVPPEMLGYAPIYNLPKVTVDLDPPPIVDSSPCAEPVKTDLPCASFCNNDKAYELVVDQGTTAVASTVLTPGRYCTTTEPVPCSKTWGILLHGIDGWECVARQPDVVGGPSANVPNFYFYNSDTLLTANQATLNGQPIDWQSADSLQVLADRENLELVCGATIDGFNMVRLGNSLKCVRDPCQTIPGTDSRWDGTKCVCGPNQINIDGPLTPCVGSNYINYGYDAATTTDYAKIECTSFASPWSSLPAAPCPSVANQISTYGYSSVGRAASADKIDRTSRTSGFVKRV